MEDVCVLVNVCLGDQILFPVCGLKNKFRYCQHLYWQQLLPTDIATSFTSIDNNNILMNFLDKDGLHLLHSGKELNSKVLSGKELTSKVHFFYYKLFLRYYPYHLNIHLNWKEVVWIKKKELSEMKTFRNLRKNLLMGH